MENISLDRETEDPRLVHPRVHVLCTLVHPEDPRLVRLEASLVLEVKSGSRALKWCRKCVPVQSGSSISLKSLHL